MEIKYFKERVPPKIKIMLTSRDIVDILDGEQVHEMFDELKRRTEIEIEHWVGSGR